MTAPSGEIHEIKGMVSDLVDYVKGEDEFRPGLAGTVKQHGRRLETAELEIKSLRIQIDRFKWTMFGMALAGATAGGGVVAAIARVAWPQN